MKKHLFISGFALTACSIVLSSCGNKPTGCIQRPIVEPTDDIEVISFQEKLLGEQEKVVLSAHEKKVYNVDKDIDDSNYLQIVVNTTGKLVGKFTYNNIEDVNEVVNEEFFIEPGENGKDTDFRQFLDAFRPKNKLLPLVNDEYVEESIGKFSKHLKSIELENFGETDVEVTLKELNLSDREIPDFDKELYVESQNIKIGMDLLTGGTLTYLERKNYDGDTIDEIIDKDNNIEIGVAYGEKDDVKKVISSHSNLINIYDAGRQIQQSYYAGIGGYGSSEEDRKDRTNDDGGTQNGYTRNISFTADKDGYYWPYNPVQGGDEKCNVSQIIDFRRTKDELYCKVRPLDWAGGVSGGYGNPANNRVTKSYMENWFKIENDMVYATNRFIDWNGFYDLENIEGHNIEMPATYISQPLHVFQSYNGQNPYADDLDKSFGNLERSTNLGPWKNGGHRTSQHTEDWFAWTNDDDFGVAVYIPGATYYSSGRSCVGIKTTDKNPDGLTLNIGAKDSPMAGDFLYNKAPCDDDSTSCYLRNTSYTAPVKAVKMKEYIPLEYTYVIAVDYVDQFRENFKEIDKEGKVKEFNNIGLNRWN